MIGLERCLIESLGGWTHPKYGGSRGNSCQLSAILILHFGHLMSWLAPIDFIVTPQFSHFGRLYLGSMKVSLVAQDELFDR